jgi:ribosomal protein S18 acetylase RimI-like enzyme
VSDRSSAIVVRDAQPDEWDAVGELTVLAYLDGAMPEAETDYVDSLRRADSRAQTATLLVAELAGQLVGTVTITPAGSPWSEIAVPGELEFRMLAVASTARRRGVAEAMVAGCIERARVHGDQRVVISVLDENEPAHALYRKLGFDRVPERDWSPVPGVNLLAYTYDVEWRPGQ